MKGFLRFGLLMVLMLTTGGVVNAQTTKTSTGSGPWTTAATWSPAGVPATGDDVVIASGHTVTTTGLSRNGSVTVNGILSTSGGFTAGSLAGTGTVAVTGTSMRTLTFGSLNTSTTFSGVITGNTNFRKTGTGTFTLSGSGANTYTGFTEIQGGGKITLGSANRIPDGSGVQLCGIASLDLNGFNETIAGLSSLSGTCGSGTGHSVTNSSATAATLTIQLLDAGYGSFSGSITGNLNLVVSGGGNGAVQDLDGANTYTGTTFVSGGIMNIQVTNAVPSSTKITITSPGQLQMSADASCSTLTLGTTLQAAGTYGSTASIATTKDDTFFEAAATGVLSVPSLLPVTWLDFTGQALTDKVLLNWKTASEQNNTGFDIERSTDGRAWSKIGFVPGKINSTTVTPYRYTDLAPLKGGSYYRLRQVDLDGRFSYSRILRINNTSLAEIVTWPNPATDQMNVGINQSYRGETLYLSVTDMKGAILLNRIVTPGITSISTSGWSKGIYAVTVRSSNEVLFNTKVIKQ